MGSFEAKKTKSKISRLGTFKFDVKNDFSLKLDKAVKLGEFYSEISKVSTKTNILWKNQVEVGTFSALILAKNDLKIEA